MTTSTTSPKPGDSRPPGESAEQVAEDIFLEVLLEAVEAVEGAQIPYLLMGGFASAALGRPRWTHDIDLFVKPADAERCLEVLARRGFATERTDGRWLYKAYAKGVLVDVIFCSADDIYLDDEMLERAQLIEFKGRRIRVIRAEDLLVIKASVFREETVRHWFDGLGIVRLAELDWDYLVKRGRERPDKVLSLLLFARASGLPVPNSVLQRLWESSSKRREAKRSPQPEEADEYVAARIHERLAEEGLEVDVCVEEGSVTLTGEAGTPERQAAIRKLASELAKGRRLVDHTTLAAYPEPERAEQIS